MRTFSRLLGRFAAAVAIAASAGVARAASPALDQVVPRGAQRGTEVEMTLNGNRLADAQDVLIYQPGIEVVDVKPVAPNAVKCKFKVAADAAYGEYQLRVRTATGISELRNFYVGVFPVVNETAEVGFAAKPKDPKNPPPPERFPSTLAKPQKIDLNVTVAGVLENEQVDFYAVDLKKGQRLSIECEGMRLGQILDTNVSVVDENKFEVEANDDNAFSRQDALVNTVVPKDGTYVIRVRESSYLGGPTGHYRMHVGTFPRPRAVYPAGGRAGDEVKVRFIGDAAGPFDQTVKVPPTPGEVLPLLAEQDGRLAPTPNPFRVSPFGNVLEAEPNDAPDKATRHDADLPIAFNGVVEKAGDVDFFRFRAKKGQNLDLHCYARRLRTPLDPVLTLHNEKGGQIAANDDNGGPDSYLKFAVPADGEYVLGVRDHLQRGGPEFVYRVEVTEVKPSLALTIPNFGVNFTQDRQWVVVPKGGRFGTTVRATRSEFGGVLKLIAKDLPPGVRMSAEPLLDGVDTFAVTFEAAADAPVGGKLVELTSAPADDMAPPVAGKFAQKVELAQSGNNAPYYVSTADRVAVAVAEPAPFAVEVVQPKAPLVQNGVADLKVRVTRKEGFKGVVNVRSLWEPPGVGVGQITIKPEDAEGTLTVNAQGNARVGPWKTAVLASSDVGGETWVASNPYGLDVAVPYLAASIARTTVTQGEATNVTVKLDQKVPFDGKAKVQLLGLPNEATTAEKEITKEDKEVVFDVRTTAKTPAGTHNGLLCRVTVMKDGEPVLHNVGNGGILRVDAPKKPAGTPAATPDPKAKPKPVAVK